MLCILYVTVVGACLGVVGLLAERMLPATAPRRWIWCLVIPISMVLPGYYRWHHNWAVVPALEQHGMSTPPGQAPGTAMLNLFDPAWWQHTESYNADINRLWIIISGMLLVWALTNAMRVSHIVSVSRTARRDPRQPTIVDGVPVVVTDAAGPATVGLLRSRVLVPRWVLALPGMQRRYILRHEEEHRRAHDARLLFVASLPLLLMPWNLAMWWHLRRLCLAVEMDCDNRVVAALGDPNAYGELLLKVAQATNGGPRLQPALLGVGTLERRLTRLLEPAPLRQIQRALLAVVVLGLMCVVLWMPHPIVGSGHQPAVTTAAVAATTAQRLH
jgi:beta-lactamase regulating signal transducer with metallopeptidase domain